MPTTYTTHVIGDLLKIQPDIFDFGFRDRLIDGLRSAVKFKLPINAEVVTNPVEVHETLAETYRLPFPKIVAEYETDLPGAFDRFNDSYPAVKVITYAEDLGNLKIAARQFGIFNAWDVDGFLLYSVAQSDNGVWVPSYYAALVPYGISTRDIVDQSYSSVKSKIGMHCFSLGGRFAEAVSQLGVNFSREQMANEMWLDSCAVLNIALCSMCENVEHEIIKPPKLLNKSRIKKGKTPFYEYRVLKVKGHANDANGNECGKRSGIRFHMRRGHIRKLQSGKLTWVRHTVVGDKSRGVVVKDYDLS